MKKYTKEFYDKSIEKKSEIIEKLFLNVTDCRWKLNKIHKHFKKDKKHLDSPFLEFIEKMRNSSKAAVSEIENLIKEEVKHKITSKAFDEYMVELDRLMKKKATVYTDRINRSKLSCLMTQSRKRMDENKDKLQAFVDHFSNETLYKFKDRVENYLDKVNMCSLVVGKKYQECLKSGETEACLEKYAKVRN